MQPQKTSETKLPAKKKIKNKNWGIIAQQPEQQIKKPEIILSQMLSNKQTKFKNISQLSKKYKFNVEAVLGSGFASTVYLGQKIDNSQPVCIKAIDMMALGFSQQRINLILKQIQCLSLFQSEYIVRLYDIYQSNTFFYLVMELCPGGDLYKMLKLAPIALPPKFIDNIIKQIAHGLMQLHQKQIIHRDLKTENIFVYKFPENPKDSLKVKIGDLGFCITLSEIEALVKQGKSIQNVGSPIYMSVQICKSQSYTFSSDVYALGIIWYELYHKKAPWQALSQGQLLNKKLQIKVEKWREDIPPRIKQIISRCISNNTQQRPTCKQIIDLIQSSYSAISSVSI